MKKRFTYLLLTFCLVLSSCSFWNNDKKKNNEHGFENIYNLKEEWSTNTKSIFQVCKPLQNDNILYIMESGYEDYGYNDNYSQFHYVEKMNLEDGSILCRSPELPVSVYGDINEYDNYLFFLDVENNLIFLDKDTLNIEKNVKIGLQNCSGNTTCHILRYKNNLIWGNKSNADNKNMVMVNVPAIFELENGQEYIPEMLYDQANGNCVCSFVIDEEILYFLTSDWLAQKGKDTCTLYAYNLETKQTLWKKELSTITGLMKCSLQIIDEKIYIIDRNLYCFNKKTGREIWIKEQKEEDKYKEVICAAESGLTGLAISDNKVYFTGYFSDNDLKYFSYPKENMKNLFCYDLKNGKYIWGDLICGTGNLDSIPLINDEKLFISTYSCFRIYDKATGKLLGDYSNYCNKESDIVFNYDDKYIFFDCHNMQGRYVAVSISEK